MKQLPINRLRLFFIGGLIGIQLLGYGCATSSTSVKSEENETQTIRSISEVGLKAIIQLEDQSKVVTQNIAISRVKGGLSLTSGAESIDSEGKLDKAGLFPSTGEYEVSILLEQNDKRYIWPGEKITVDTKEDVDLGTIILEETGAIQGSLDFQKGMASVGLKHNVDSLTSAANNLLTFKLSLADDSLPDKTKVAFYIELPQGSYPLILTPRGNDGTSDLVYEELGIGNTLIEGSEAKDLGALTVKLK